MAHLNSGKAFHTKRHNVEKCQLVKLLSGLRSQTTQHIDHRVEKKVSGFKTSVGLHLIVVPPCRYRVHGARVKYKSTVWRNLGGQSDEDRMNS